MGFPYRSFGALTVALTGLPGGFPQSASSYPLPPRPLASYGACSIAATPAASAVGIAWGGRSPDTGGYDHFCRGFRLVPPRARAGRVVVRLPSAQHKGRWVVDEPVLVGKWLAYQRYLRSGGGDWQIELVNVRNGVTRQLDHWGGQGIQDVGPVLTVWGHTLVWVSGTREKGGSVVYNVHTYNVATGVGKVVASGPPGVRLIDAYMAGPLICYLRESSRGTDVWVKDLRSQKTRQLTSGGRATEAVITGPWVAWHVLGANDLGAVIVEDLRSGRRWTATQSPSYQLSASNGFLAWDSTLKDQWSMLDLLSGRAWSPGRFVVGQQHATSIRVENRVVVLGATTGNELDGRVLVYPSRRLPAAPTL